MKEQFVPCEIADALKAKGFSLPVLGLYNDIVGYGEIGLSFFSYKSSYYKKYGAILWQQVFDWLREKHQIEIVLSGITVYDIRKYHVCLYYNVDGIMTDHPMLLFNEETGEYTGYQTFTYQEARQAAIEHALTLI
jgi:hypothetical protein